MLFLETTFALSYQLWQSLAGDDINSQVRTVTIGLSLFRYWNVTNLRIYINSLTQWLADHLPTYKCHNPWRLHGLFHTVTVRSFVTTNITTPWDLQVWCGHVHLRFNLESIFGWTLIHCSVVSFLLLFHACVCVCVWVHARVHVCVKRDRDRHRQYCQKNNFGHQNFDFVRFIRQSHV